MPRTPTLPPTEPAMWRKRLSRTHPDTGSDHELFIWARNLHDVVCARVREDPPPPPRSSTPKEGPARVPFDENAQDFENLTHKALSLADTVDAPYDRLLRLLEDCEEGEESTLHAQYIAERSQGAGMLEHLDRARLKTGFIPLPTQWEDEDFEIVGMAFAELFESKGWKT